MLAGRRFSLFKNNILNVTKYQNGNLPSFGMVSKQVCFSVVAAVVAGAGVAGAGVAGAGVAGAGVAGAFVAGAFVEAYCS